MKKMEINRKKIIINIRTPVLFPEFHNSNFNNKLCKQNETIKIRPKPKIYSSKSYIEKMKYKYPVLKNAYHCFLEDHDLNGNIIDNSAKKFPIDDMSDNKKLHYQTLLYDKSFGTSKYEKQFPLFKGFNCSSSTGTLTKYKSANRSLSQDNCTIHSRSIDDHESITANQKMRKKLTTLNKEKLNRNSRRITMSNEKERTQGNEKTHDKTNEKDQTHDKTNEKDKERSIQKTKEKPIKKPITKTKDSINLAECLRNYKQNLWLTQDVPDNNTNQIRNSHKKASHFHHQSTTIFCGKGDMSLFDYSSLFTSTSIPSMKIDPVLLRREKSYKKLNKFDYMYKSLLK